MIPLACPALLIPGFVLLTFSQTTQAKANDIAQPTVSFKAAAQYLDGRADAWLKWSGAARGQGTTCVSCHTTLPFALARSALGNQLGDKVAGNTERRLIENVRQRVDHWDNIVTTSATDKNPFVPYYPKERHPSALGTESVLSVLVLVNHDARRAKGVLSASTKTALAHLWQQQQANGAWLWLDFGLRPWEQADASYHGAALAALAVGTAGKDYYAQAELQPKVTALKKYLKTQFMNQPLHHRVTGLWASSRLPGVLDEADKKQLIDELLKAQQADGGWSLPQLGQTVAGKNGWKSHGVYPEGSVSDGYATGLVVLALKQSGMAVDQPNLKKAVDWLVTHQQQDGTWPTHYVNRPRDPHNNVGMFLRDAATAFAVLALVE